DQLLLGEVLSAIEGHVFQKMGQAQLVLVLEDGADVDYESQFGPILGLAVLQDVVAQAVGKFARDDGREYAKCLSERNAGGLSRQFGCLLGSKAGRQEREQGRDKNLFGKQDNLPRAVHTGRV